MTLERARQRVFDTGSMDIKRGALGRDCMGRVIETEVVQYAVD